MSEWSDIIDDWRSRATEAIKSGGTLVTDEQEYKRLEFAQYMVTCEEIYAHFSSGNEQAAANKILFSGNFGLYSSKRLLKDFVHQFKDNQILFRCITGVYMNDGYKFPRSLIQNAKRISKEIDESQRLEGLPDENTVTVYRGTISDPHTAKYETSWTTDINVAIWFAYRDCRGANVYQGEIARNKVIAFLNGRKEFEVLQHGNVRNIKKLAITPQQVSDAQKFHAESCNIAVNKILAGE